MSLPEFNENGDLPPGIHKTTLGELLNRFSSGSPKRMVLALRLKRIYQIALDTGHLARFIIFRPQQAHLDSPFKILYKKRFFDCYYRVVQAYSRLVFLKNFQLPRRLFPQKMGNITLH